VAFSNGSISATNTIDVSSDAMLSPSVAGVDSGNNLLVTYGTNAAGGDLLYKTEELSGGGYDAPEQMDQEQGPTIPELPKSSVWKILVAVLALAIVIGLAAWRRKKVPAEPEKK
jgi:hypothetical protein